VIARGLTTEAMAITDGDARKGKLAQARKLESAASIRGILHLAATEDTIAITSDDVDADVFLLNCTNCTVDLRTMTLHAHDPADLLTKMTGAAYDPGATGPEWAKFLARVQPDEAMRSYLARLTGHALEGRVRAPLLAILHETDAGRRLAEGTVKRLTGGDPIKAGECGRTSGRSSPATPS
jgi:putative DNA primase/helicase